MNPNCRLYHSKLLLAVHCEARWGCASRSNLTKNETGSLRHTIPQVGLVTVRDSIR